MGKEIIVKTITMTLLTLVTAVACSTTRPKKITVGPHQSGSEAEDAAGDPLLMPPSIEAKDLDAEVQSLSRIEQLKRSPVAVWIDGAGYDAIEALGFLQTLEKSGVKPALVVGTGFGCWVALSWAIDGSANRAEWQTFKWVDWKLISDNSIFNRLRGRSAHDQFAEELVKIFPPQKVSSLRVPADCLYLESQNGLYFYKSSTNDNVETALWRQLQVDPLVGRARVQKEEEETHQYSGYSFYWPEPSALRFAAMEAGKGEPSYTWIVLKGYRVGKSLTAAQVKFRSQKSEETLKEMRTRGLLYSVTSTYKYTAAEIKDPKQRRKFLLRGRKEGERFLNRLLSEDLVSESQTKN